MYKGIVQNKNSSYAYISLRLYNGTEARICSHIKDEEIMEYFNFIYMHNSKILFHNEPANRTNYNNRVYAYKNGIIKIDPVDISVPLNRDEYDFSGVFPKRKDDSIRKRNLKNISSRIMKIARWKKRLSFIVKRPALIPIAQLEKLKEFLMSEKRRV